MIAQMQHRAALAVRGAFRRGLFPYRSFRFSPLENTEIPVLMCLWNRPERLREVLLQLDGQSASAGVRLFLWNNQRSDHAGYLRDLAEFTASGALRRVDIVKSPFNLGSIARFYWAARLGRRRSDLPIVVLDDDQDVDQDFVSTAFEAYRPDAVAAWWAFRIESSSYWDRTPSAVGETVDHVGPGGSVMPSSLFVDGEFFRQIPDQFWFLDDLWLSWFARHRGYTLTKLDVDVRFVLDDSNQFHGQIDQKQAFFELLHGGER